MNLRLNCKLHSWAGKYWLVGCHAERKSFPSARKKKNPGLKNLGPVIENDEEPYHSRYSGMISGTFASHFMPRNAVSLYFDT